MSTKVERTKPGSKNDYRVTYDTGAQKWTDDKPGDGKGLSSGKGLKGLMEDPAVQRGSESISKALKSGKGLEEAYSNLKRDVGEKKADIIMKALKKRKSSDMDFQIKGPWDAEKEGIIVSGEGWGWTAVVDGKTVGYIYIKRNLEFGEKEWYIGTVAVDPEYRRHGISTALHDEAYRWAKRHGGLQSGMITSDENMMYWKKLLKRGEAEEIKTKYGIKYRRVAGVNPYLNTPPTELERKIKGEKDKNKRKQMQEALSAWRVTIPGPFSRGFSHPS